MDPTTIKVPAKLNQPGTRPVPEPTEPFEYHVNIISQTLFNVPHSTPLVSGWAH